MFNEFIEQLKSQLTELKYTDIDNVIAEVTAKYNNLIENGESEESAVAELGDPIKLAYDISGKDMYKADKKASKDTSSDPKTMTGVYLNDAMYFGLGLTLSVLGTIAMAFVSALCGVAGGIYCYKAWADPIFTTVASQTYAFIMAICGLIMFGLGAFLTYVIIKKLIKGTKKYLTERKDIVNRIQGQTK